jgi:hexosaminidase
MALIPGKQEWKLTSGPTGDSHTLPSDLQIVEAAVKRAREDVLGQTFVPWKFHARHSVFEPVSAQKEFVRVVNVLAVKPTAPNLLNLSSESYSLHITEGGVANISSSTSIGLLRGLTTLSQLFYDHSEVIMCGVLLKQGG